MVEDPWEPLTPAEVSRLFAAVDVPWWIAGGYAVELAAGRPLRAHGDIDVLLLRRDQLAAQCALASWRDPAARRPRHLVPPERFTAVASAADAGRIGGQ